MAATFKLEIVTPQAEKFAGEVVSLRIPAYEGSLGVLAHHAPMLVELVPGVMNVTLPGGEIEIFGVTGGYLEVGENRAILLVDAAERPGEIDVERAEAARARAEKRLQEKRERLDAQRAELALKRALVRLHVARQLRRVTTRR